tara:strand:+ start:113 stop:322 length:210 start_codon:yes stop_codon:yes gene_type:complete
MGLYSKMDSSLDSSAHAYRHETSPDLGSKLSLYRPLSSYSVEKLRCVQIFLGNWKFAPYFGRFPNVVFE